MIPKVLSLTGSFRCARQIVQCANRLVDGNMTALRDVDGTVLVREFADEGEELVFIIDAIKRNAGDYDYCDVAVLLRYNVLVDRYALALSKHFPVAQNKSVLPKDWARAMRLISFMSDPDRDSNALYYLEASEGKEEAKRAKERAVSELTTVKNAVLGPNRAYPLYVLEAVLDECHVDVEVIMAVGKLASELPPGARHSELLMAMAEYQNECPTGLGVTVCTVHAAKSREFSTVFCPAFEQGIMPKDPNDPEDRRLAYVAITRAADQLVLTHVQHRTDLWSGASFVQKPSHFIKEMGL